MDKADLYRRVGCQEQLFGARDMYLNGGKQSGVRAIELYNACGMEIMVLPDRGMDISSLRLGGINLSFLSKTGITAPEFFNESRDSGFFKNFYVGFMTTCGLSYMGAACEDEDHELGLHGLISNIPASEVCARVDWSGEEPIISAVGTVKQAEVFGEHLVMKREIRLKGFDNELHIHDTIENRALLETPFMLLYHMNYGYPLLDTDTQICLPSIKTTARNDYAKEALRDCNFTSLPEDSAEEMVFSHAMATDSKGKSAYAVYNRKLGYGVKVIYPAGILPWMTHWKCNRSGEYVLGLEPGNCHVLGRRKARENGELIFLKPLEEVEIDITVRGLVGEQQIEEAVNAITKGEFG